LCHTPDTTSRHSSGQNSAEDLDFISEEEKKELTHYFLNKAGLQRDVYAYIAGTGFNVQ
jgi:hypothetical protein